MLYVAATTLATLIGYLVGTVRLSPASSSSLKYVEYFVVYYMVVNNLPTARTPGGWWRWPSSPRPSSSVVGIAQIPSGERVSAPFEGEVGEPNTFGGLPAVLMAIAGGIALETRRFRMRVSAGPARRS